MGLAQFDLSIANSPDEFAAFLRKDNEGRAKAVKISGAKAE